MLRRVGPTAKSRSMEISESFTAFVSTLVLRASSRWTYRWMIATVVLLLTIAAQCSVPPHSSFSTLMFMPIVPLAILVGFQPALCSMFGFFIFKVWHEHLPIATASLVFMGYY